MSAWLHIVGIGEDGFDGLTPATRAVVEAADVIIGGDRHHRLSGSVTAERLAWPHPFDALVDVLKGLKGKRVVVLATGDPLWFSVGARIGRAIPSSEIIYHPQLSAFQLAAARMGWSMADLETLTVHGRPVEQMIAFIQPDQRLLILTTGADTPAQIAKFLAERGFGRSPMTVLAAMGGADEARFDGLAKSWDHVVPAFNTLAVECVAATDAALLPRVPGLADELFQHDGTMTKQEVRAVTVAKLMPMRGALLWDIGTGCGSVAVEWMRAAFIDSADWVMVPNVIGMALYADGGQMATKPYAAGGNYISRMSDYCRECRFDPKLRTGEDACPYTTLYWDFLARHRTTLAANHRMGRQMWALDRLADLPAVRQRAEWVRDALSSGDL